MSPTAAPISTAQPNTSATVCHVNATSCSRGISRSVYGQQHVARLLASFVPRYSSIGARVRVAELNGQTGALFFDDQDRLINVFAFDVADGAIQAVRSIINPDKLAHLGYPLSEYARRGA